MYAEITHDLLYEPNEPVWVRSREGQTWGHVGRPAENTLVRFRILDDDRIPYYKGVGTDDALETVFDWAQRDAGCTILQVRKNGEWKDEIG